MHRHGFLHKSHHIRLWSLAGERAKLHGEFDFVFFYKDLFKIVDTPGFGDTDSEDEVLMEEMMSTLSGTINHADTIMLLLKGDASRFNDSLIKMVKRMTIMFGHRLEYFASPQIKDANNFDITIHMRVEKKTQRFHFMNGEFTLYSSLVFGNDWWDFAVIGVSFWSYSQVKRSSPKTNFVSL